MASHRTPAKTTDEETVVDEPVVDEPVEVGITAAEFVKNASHAVGVSGLLASDEQLRTASLPEAKWEALLADYMASPRP